MKGNFLVLNTWSSAGDYYDVAGAWICYISVGCSTFMLWSSRLHISHCCRTFRVLLWSTVYLLCCFRAVWYDESSFPQSWEIDPSEGPGRVRKRLQRCQLVGVETKFLLDDEHHKVGRAQSSPPLQYIFEDGQQSESASAALIYRLHTNETIRWVACYTNTVWLATNLLKVW